MDRDELIRTELIEAERRLLWREVYLRMLCNQAWVDADTAAHWANVAVAAFDARFAAKPEAAHVGP